MKNIWVYIPEKKIFKKFREDSPRLIKNWPHTPTGYIRLITRGKSSYVPCGETSQEAADSANKNALVRIQEIEKELAAIKSRLVVPPW
jgi:hypothetical protein